MAANGGLPQASVALAKLLGVLLAVAVALGFRVALLTARGKAQVWLLVSVVLLWEVLLWADGSRSAEARQGQRRRLSNAASWHDWPLDSRELPSGERVSVRRRNLFE